MFYPIDLGVQYLPRPRHPAPSSLGLAPPENTQKNSEIKASYPISSMISEKAIFFSPLFWGGGGSNMALNFQFRTWITTMTIAYVIAKLAARGPLA